LVFWGIFVFFNQAFAQNLILNDLIEEALKNNREIIASQDRVEVAKNRIPQASSLPDPMLMAGYQNEGLRRYTYGEAENAQWMFTASQMFPFWGKRGLKSEMAARDAQSLSEMQKVIQLKTISRVSEIYFDLFQTYKNIDLIRDRGALFSKIEDIAASRYATGMSSQQEVLMAQTEKYTLLEREEMLKQKILSLEAMLLSALGRASSESLGRPAERPVTKFIPSLNDVLKQGESHSPEIKSRQRMMEAAEAKLKMTRKEYFPDVTMNASVFPRGGEFENMYSLTASFNIPIYYKSKQRPAVQEANAGLNQAKHELEATKYMISAAIRDNYSMVRSAEKLMELYRNGLIPKTYQDFELAVSGYGTGRVDAIVAITRLKNLLDFETLYWTQYAEREKAIARMRAIIGGE
jgi:outer membrane protein TolC